MSGLLRHWFAHPEALWLLLLLFGGAIVGWWSRRRRQQALAQMGSGLAFEQMIWRRRGWLVRLRPFCHAWGLVLLIVGIAGPQWGQDWNQSAAPGRDLVVVLDLSRSMLAESPSRLVRAQRGLIRLSKVVQSRGGHRLGMVIFAGKARVVCPLTHDYDHFREVVMKYDRNHLDPKIWPSRTGVSGTRIGQGVQMATEIHAPDFVGAQDILLISDGDDPANDEEWRLGATAAQLAEIPVHCVGIGDPEREHPIPGENGYATFENKEVRTRLHSEPLEQIAQRSGGIYVPAHVNDVDLGELFLQRMASGPRREESADVLPVYQQRFVWFLTPAFALLIASLAIRGRR